MKALFDQPQTSKGCFSCCRLEFSIESIVNEVASIVFSIGNLLGILTNPYMAEHTTSLVSGSGQWKSTNVEQRDGDGVHSLLSKKRGARLRCVPSNYPLHCRRWCHGETRHGQPGHAEGRRHSVGDEPIDSDFYGEAPCIG